MKVKLGMIAALSILAACAVPADGNRVNSEGFIEELPEGVIALAAPNQNLQTVRLRSDGCYWYQHTGPVETTMLPLRTPDGRPICNRPVTPPEATT